MLTGLTGLQTPNIIKVSRISVDENVFVFFGFFLNRNLHNTIFSNLRFSLTSLGGTPFLSGCFGQREKKTIGGISL